MKRIVIRNWRKYQHYSRRVPPWIKLMTRLIDSVHDGGDEAYNGLPDAAKILLVHVWLLASRHNSAQADTATLPYDLDWLRPRLNFRGNIASTLASIIDSGLLSVSSSEEKDASNPASVVLLTTLSSSESLSSSVEGVQGEPSRGAQYLLGALKELGYLGAAARWPLWSQLEQAVTLCGAGEVAAAIIAEKRAYIAGKGWPYIAAVIETAVAEKAYAATMAPDEAGRYVEQAIASVRRFGVNGGGALAAEPSIAP